MLDDGDVLVVVGLEDEAHVSGCAASCDDRGRPGGGTPPGLRCAAPRCARGSLRCSRRKGGCGTARAALNAPRLHGSSPVRRLRRRTPPASLRFSPAHIRPNGVPPRAMRRTWLFVEERLSGAGKAVVGCTPAATCAAPSSAGLVAACAQRAASSSDSSRLFERSERSGVASLAAATRPSTAGDPARRAGCRIRAPAHTRPRLCLARSRQEEDRTHLKPSCAPTHRTSRWA